LLKNKGQSISLWVALLAVVSMGLLFSQKLINRPLRDKITASADYCFWGRWGQDTQQYKGDDSVALKSVSQQQAGTSVWETKTPRKILPSAWSGASEHNVSVAVGEDFRSVLKAQDMDQYVLPDKDQLVAETNAIQNELEDVEDNLGG